MIEQLSRMKAWAEFVEWMRNKGYKYDQYFWFTYNQHASYRELLSLLVEFCDSKEWRIGIGYDEDHNSFTFSIKYKKELKDIGEDFNSRTEATKQAIIKCFELMEKE